MISATLWDSGVFVATENMGFVMKKGNILIFTALAALSLLLLGLWYFLGLYKDNDPLSLVLTITWWVLVIAVVIVIIRIEKARRQRIRTISVTEHEVYNSEAGIIPYDDTVRLMAILENILKDLAYDFKIKEPPDKRLFPPKLLIHTDRFALTGSDKDTTWKGEVIFVELRQRTAFGSKAELFDILNIL